MGQDGSVAPRERVNIVYKAATGDASEEKELPLKLLMMGDYTLRADETPLEERKAVNINKNNFNDVMKAMDLKLTFSVKNTLAGDGSEMPVSLSFSSLKDFEPESVANQVPELKKLLELRQALSALKAPLGNVRAFREKIQSLVADDAAREKMLKELGVGEGDGE